MTSAPAGWRGGARVVAILAITPFARLPAQVAVHLSAGARYTTTMVNDSIVTRFSVRPAIAPALALTIGTPIDTTGKWTVEAILDWSHSDLVRHDQDGSTQSLGGLGTLGVSVGMRRHLLSWLSARASVGGLKYLPASQTGIFSLGSGSLSPLGGLAVEAAPPFGARWGLAFETRVDLHQFITPALRAEGFQDSRRVVRLALGVRAGLGASR
ncbi:MAG TPA: hypothetical protein VI139_09770 [Gemmatimonadales bacterium]